MTPRMNPGACLGKLPPKRTILQSKWPMGRRRRAWIGPCVWCHDRHPALGTQPGQHHEGAKGLTTDIPGGDLVCVPSEAAFKTSEFLPVTIALGDVVAGRAGPGGVFRVHHEDGDACQCALVLQEAAQLVERPRVMGAAL